MLAIGHACELKVGEFMNLEHEVQNNIDLKM